MGQNKNLNILSQIKLIPLLLLFDQNLERCTKLVNATVSKIF